METNKESSKETVLIGLSGGVHSGIVSYLLKLQKYELHALTIDLGNSTLSEENLKDIKTFCHKLNITHHLINVEEEYKELVLDRYLSDQIDGLATNLELYTSVFVLEKLHQHRKNLNLEHLACGSRAKILKKPDGSVILHTLVSDEDNTHQLAMASNEVLKDLTLPLGDLGDAEIQRLKENFGVENLQGPKMDSSHIDFKIPASLTVKESSLNSSKRFLLIDTHQISPTDLVMPFKGHVMTENSVKIDCLIVPRNQNTLLIELSEEDVFPEGKFLSVGVMAGKASRIVSHGRVKYIKEVESEEDSPVFKF